MNRHSLSAATFLFFVIVSVKFCHAQVNWGNVGKNIRRNLENSGNAQAIREFNALGEAANLLSGPRQGIFEPIPVPDNPRMPSNNPRGPRFDFIPPESVVGPNYPPPRRSYPPSPDYPVYPGPPIYPSYPTAPNRVVYPSVPQPAPSVPANPLPSISDSSGVPSNTTVPPNSEPTQDAPELALKPNSEFIPKAMNLTSGQQRQSLDGMRKKASRDIDSLEAELMSKSELTKAVIGLPDATYDVAKKQQLIDAILAGDRLKISTFPDDGSAAMKELKKQGEARATLNDLRELALKGRATDKLLIEAAKTLKDAVDPTRHKNVDKLLADIRIKNQVIDLLDSAIPGNGMAIIPAIGTQTVVFVPGLLAGTIIDLGNGAYLVSGRSGRLIEIQFIPLVDVIGVVYFSIPPIKEAKSRVSVKETLISNSTNTPFRYLINGKSFTMEPAFQQLLPPSTAWTVSFDQGGGKGTRVAQLTAGIYNVVVSEGHWSIQKSRASFSIDNSKNAKEFNYLIEGKFATVAPFAVASHESETLIDLKFDDGYGNVKRKVLWRGTYVVGLTSDKNSIDLFDKLKLVVGASSAPHQPSEDLFGT